VEELAPIGEAPDWTRAGFAHDPAQLVRVVFTPNQTFNQTPGPDAGKQVSS
jgi:hypothetical protein